MNLLSHLKIRTKLASMVTLAALTVFAVVAVSALLSRNRMLDDRVEQIHTAADTLYGLAQALQEDVAAGKMTVDQAKDRFRLTSHHMTFNNGQGYPVAYNVHDTSLLVQTANVKLEGKILGTKDANGVVIAEAQIAAARLRPEGSTTTYLYPRPGESVAARKVAYVRYFAPWNIVMSYGLYVDDIDADVNALLLRLGAIGGGLMLLVALTSWLIARDVLGALDRQKNQMQRIAAGSLDEPVGETGRGDEIGRMAETLEVLRQTAMTARSLEAEQAATKTRSETEKRDALIVLADRFDASVGQLVGLMASGSSELEATAKSM